MFSGIFVRNCICPIARAALVAAAMSLAGQCAFAQTYIFGRADFPVDGQSVVIGDFNGDGVADLVVAEEGAVSVSLGKVGGTFGPPITYQDPHDPDQAFAVAMGDFNGDGNPDFAAVNVNCVLVNPGGGVLPYPSCTTGSVSVYLGIGDGTFLEPIDYPTGTTPVSIATADLNGDGKPDLIVLNQGLCSQSLCGSVSVLLGNGDGTFKPQQNYATANLPTRLAVADLNGDQKLDLIVAYGGGPNAGLGGVSILLGNGDGTFAAHQDMPVTVPTGDSVTVGDFNGDGKLDVALGGMFITVLLGRGDGTFVYSNSYANTNGFSFLDYCQLAICVGPAVRSADINGDGELDLISPGQVSTEEYVTNVANVFLGNGDGSFQVAVPYGTNINGADLALADINGDGKLDIVSSDGSVLLGLDKGLFVGTTQYPMGGNGPCWGAAGDFNKDGATDVVLLDCTNPTAWVLLGNGDGTFQTAKPYPAGPSPVSVVVGDFNNDGTSDLAVANDPGTVSILLGDGDGTFQAPVSYAVNAGKGYIAVGDFNGDGNVDLAVSNGGNGSGDSISILLGNGDGTFKNHVDYLTPLAPLQLVTGDFNLDGKLDLAVVDSAGFSVLLGNGNGTFQSFVNYSGGSGPAMVAADFNHDGKSDVATGGSGIFVSLGNGDGTFMQPQGYSGPPGTLRVLLTTDFNGDGNPDLIANNLISDYTTEADIFLNDGTGAMHFASSYPLGLFVADDFNSDGVPDIGGSGGYQGEYFVAMLSSPFKAVNPNALNFGSWGLGTTSTSQTITIGNPSNVSFTIASFVASANFAATNNCPVSLTPGMTCTVTVTFSPGSAGLETGTLTMTDGTRSSPQAIALAGTGVNGPFLSPSPVRLNFDAIGVGNISSPQTTTLINSGNAALTLTGITIAGANSADYSQTNNCGSSLAVGASCSVAVKFAPSAGGSRLASLSISDNATGSPQEISLVGIGAAPVASLSPTSLTFGPQALGTTSSPQTLILTNTGSAPLDITQIAASGDFAETNACSASLAAGSNCQINVTFTPTLLGTRAGNITVTDNASGSPQTVAVSGAGGSLDLGVGSGGSNKATVSAGQTATYNLSIGGGGVAGTANLTCSGAPTGATCSLPASVNVSATNASMFTVTVTTTAHSSAAVVPNSFMHSGWLWAGVLMGITILSSSSKKRRLSAARCLPIAFLLFIASCGGGGSSGSGGSGGGGNGGTPAGNYTITVKAVSGSLVESLPLTLTVQ